MAASVPDASGRAEKNDQVAVHVFTPERWELMRELRLNALTEAPYAFGSTVERARALTEEEWVARCATGRNFFATLGGRPAGIIGAYVPDEQHPERLELVSMWVAPEYRRRGIARRLVDAVIDRARSEGASAVHLWVADGNDSAEQLYLACGFTPTGRKATPATGYGLAESELALQL